MLILGSTILVSLGSQGCAQKLHKKVTFKKIYICFCKPIQVEKLYKSWNMVTMIRLFKFELNSWYLVGGLCPRVGTNMMAMDEIIGNFLFSYKPKKKPLFFNLEMLAFRFMIWDLGWDQNDWLIKYTNLFTFRLIRKKIIHLYLYDLHEHFYQPQLLMTARFRIHMFQKVQPK